MDDIQEKFKTFLNGLVSTNTEVRENYDALNKADIVTLLSLCLKKLGFNVGELPENHSVPEMSLAFYLGMYRWIIGVAKSSKMNLRQFVKLVGLDEVGSIASDEKRGFVYYSPREEVERFVADKLSEIFPDKTVHHISKMYSLYQAVMRCAYAKNMTIEEYLRSLGYKYENRRGGGGAGRPFGRRALSDEDIRERLKELYPDGDVKGLASCYRSLYTTIRNHADANQTNVQEYLQSLGFKYNVKPGRFNGSPNVEQMLAAAFPSRQIDSFQDHKHLYERIRRIAKQRNADIAQVLREYGYEYHHPMKEKVARVKQELLNLYPDRIVVNLTKTKLYQRLMRHANDQNMSLKEYLKHLGFEYYGAARINTSDIVKELKKLYPKKVIKGISKHPGLYENIRRKAANRELTISQYLRDIGFTYINPKQDVNVSIASVLTRYYPDGQVESLSQHKTLYARVQKQAKSKGLNISEYLKTIGFQYHTRS